MYIWTHHKIGLRIKIENFGHWSFWSLHILVPSYFGNSKKINKFGGRLQTKKKKNQWKKIAYKSDIKWKKVLFWLHFDPYLENHKCSVKFLAENIRYLKKKKKPTINQTFKNFGCWLHCMLKIATSITKSLRQFYKELKEENVIKTGWKINTSQKTRKHPFWHLGGKPLFLQMEDDNKSLT